jgi:ferric-dicitrate binding protein FerR (iron transport regulator)
MDEQYIQQLLQRYQQGDLTAEELSVLEQWYAGLNKTQEPFFRPGANKQAHLQNLLQQIHQGIDQATPIVEHEQSPSHKTVFAWRWAAAAAVLLMVAVGSWFWYRQLVPQAVPIAATIEVPVGKTYKISLPDSSAVWLSGGARLAYLQDYGRHTRTVALQKGKAFFDVKKDPSHPFIVQAGNLQTKVLGTSFTVNLEDSLHPAVAVATGKVAVSLGSRPLSVLPPGKELRVQSATGKYQVNDLPVALVNAWTSNELVLTGVDFSALTQAFAQFYNVSVHTDHHTIQQNKYTITFKREVEAEKVLEVICRLYHNQYRKLPNGSYSIY